MRRPMPPAFLRTQPHIRAVMNVIRQPDQTSQDSFAMQEPVSAAPKRRQHSLATDLVTELSQRILLGKIAPGQKLPSENQIVREHGVSRTVVREAISKLQASGLVVTHHGIGTFVLERSDQTGLRLKVETVSRVRDIIELRIGLETQAVALAAVRRTDE
ncbi:GntR family transcriptional regulator, partial [Pseudomonas savastanoi]